MKRMKANKDMTVLNKSGAVQSGRRIDEGDICLVGDSTAGLYPVLYPVKGGTRSAFVKSLVGFSAGYRVYNQNVYGHVPYPAAGYEKATVRSGGCGVVAMAMVVENLVLSMLDPVECAAIALKCGARVSGGTDLKRLGAMLGEKYGMTMTCTSDGAALRACLDRGGVAVVNTGGDRKGHQGIFSSGGHYIVLLGRKGEKALIADPGDYAEKYKMSHRKGVSREGSLLRAGLDLVAADSGNRSPSYYLFERRDGCDIQ